MGKATMLHITDGESVAGTLRESAIHGEVRVYGDLMYEGQASDGFDAKGWLEARARFLSGNGRTTLEEAHSYLETFEDSLDAASNYDETVLWLDHRLSDQLILIKLLDWFSRRDLGRAKLSLICRDRYPGMDRFVGLGQLRADQLASLADTRLRVSDAQFHLASMAWSAFTSSNPTAIERIIEQDTSVLPFLASALRRHLEQFPSVDNGLSRTEREIVSVLRQHGSLSAIKLFFAVQQRENPPFMGDLSFFGILTELSSARYPLICCIEDTGQLGPKAQTNPIASYSRVTITEVGLRILDGQEDHLKLNGIDGWLGGVRLNGADTVWRWDSASARLVI